MEKFKKEYIDSLIEYFDIPANFLEKVETATKVEWKEFASNLPTIQGFCAKIKIDRDTFYRWLKEGQDESYMEKDKKYKNEFYTTYKKCIDIQESIWIENGLKGLYSQTFATFVGKNIFGWKDKIEGIDKVGDSEKEVFQKGLKDKVNEMTSEEIDKILVELLK